MIFGLIFLGQVEPILLFVMGRRISGKQEMTLYFQHDLFFNILFGSVLFCQGCLFGVFFLSTCFVLR